MTYPIRPVTAEEYPAHQRAAGQAFGQQPTDEDIALFRPLFEFGRGLAAFDGDSIVATAGALSFELTLPGGTTLPAAGVTLVGVLPTYRRRGLLRALMRRQFDDVRERGEPLAILGASESLLYGRFGYGPATHAQGLEIERRHAAFARDFHDEGRVSLLTPGEVARVLPEVYERARLGQPGALTRGTAWWSLRLLDREIWRDGASALFVAVHEARGLADGYVAYRIKRHWEHGLARGTLLIDELIATTPHAHAALWEYCLSMDLVETVRLDNGALDEPLHWMLADPRRLRVTRQGDALWARILDVPRALSTRRYRAEGRLILDVADTFCPHLAGRYALEGGPEGASCRPTTAEADLRLEVTDLGATYLGGVRFSTLARAGRIAEVTPGALRRADAMFASDPLPWCVTDF